MKKILLFLLTFLACTYSAQAQECIYIVGDGNGLLGWKDPTSANASAYVPYKLAKVSENVFEGTFTLNGDVYFRFYKELTGYDGDASLGAPDGGGDWNLTSQVGTTDLEIVQKNQRNWYLGADGSEYLFTVNLNTNTLRVSRVLYLRGAWTDKWDAEPAYKFNCDKGVYTLTVDGATVQGKGWQIATNNWSYKYGVKDAIPAGGPYTLEWDKNAGFTGLDEGKYDLVYNYSTKELTVTAVTITYPTMKLACAAYGWSGSEGLFTKNGDGTWTLTIDNVNDLAGKEFKILDGNGNLYGNGNSSGEVSFTVNEPCGLYSNNVNAVKFDSSLSGSVVLSLSKYAINDDGKGGKFYSVELTITADTPSYPELWLRGGWNNGWDIPSEGGAGAAIKFATTDGIIYTLSVDGATINDKEWKIANSDYSYEYGASKDISIGKHDLAEKSQNKFINLAEDATYDLEYNYNTHVLIVTEQGSTPTPTPTYPENIYLYDGSSEMMTIAAKDKANGVYEATLNIGADFSFRFYSDKNKPDDASYGPNTAAGSGYEAYTLGETKGMTNGSTNCWQLTNAAGEYTFTVDLKNLTFVVNAVTPTTYPDLYVRGIGGKWNDLTYMMDCTGGVYTLNDVALSNTQFKIGSDETDNGVDWKYSFGAASDAEGVLDVTADGQEWTIYDVLRGNNLHIGEVSGTVDITFKPDFTAGKGTLTIKPHDTPVVGYKVYVVRPVDAEETPNIYCYDGFTNGSWPGEAMKRAENDLVLTEGERPIYVYTVESACKVIISTGEDGKGPWRYPADQATGVQINEDTIIIISENEKATYGPFDPSKVSGVNDVEIFDEAPVEFYNLQGVRVDGELTPGLYIRRQGGNASKILIR